MLFKPIVLIYNMLGIITFFIISCNGNILFQTLIWYINKYTFLYTGVKAC